MVGSDQVPSPIIMITSEPLVEAAVRHFRDRATRLILQFRFSTVWHSPGLGREIQQKQNLSAKERSSTELRFASFPHPLWGVGRAVKGRDERPTGALDSPPDPKAERCAYFLLDTADDFIDGMSLDENRALRELRRP